VVWEVAPAGPLDFPVRRWCRPWRAARLPRGPDLVPRLAPCPWSPGAHIGGPASDSLFAWAALAHARRSAMPVRWAGIGIHGGRVIPCSASYASSLAAARSSRSASARSAGLSSRASSFSTRRLSGELVASTPVLQYGFQVRGFGVRPLGLPDCPGSNFAMVSFLCFLPVFPDPIRRGARVSRWHRIGPRPRGRSARKAAGSGRVRRKPARGVMASLPDGPDSKAHHAATTNPAGDWRGQ